MASLLGDCLELVACKLPHVTWADLNACQLFSCKKLILREIFTLSMYNNQVLSLCLLLFLLLIIQQSSILKFVEKFLVVVSVSREDMDQRAGEDQRGRREKW